MEGCGMVSPERGPRSQPSWPCCAADSSRSGRDALPVKGETYHRRFSLTDDEGLCPKTELESGRRLGIGVGTVKSHVCSILGKTGRGSRVQAVLLAHQARLMSGARSISRAGQIGH